MPLDDTQQAAGRAYALAAGTNRCLRAQRELVDSKRGRSARHVNEDPTASNETLRAIADTTSRLPRRCRQASPRGRNRLA